MKDRIHAPDISVVLCTYNAWPYLESAVTSVLNSESVRFELVIVNDGSDDESADYLNQLNDERVFVIHQENRGIAHAANTGIENAQAEFIARFDADDLMHPKRLQLHLDYLREHPSVDVLASTVELMDAEFNQTGLAKYVDWTNHLLSHADMAAHRYRDATLVNPSATFRKQVWSRLGGYKQHVPEDYEFWMRGIEAGIRFAKLDVPLLKWRDLSTRLTRSHDDYSERSFREVKLNYFYSEWKERPARSLYIWGKNREASKWYEGLLQRGIVVGGFVDFQSGDWKGLEVLSIEDALKFQEAFFLIAVRDRKGNGLILEALNETGRSVQADYYCV